MDGDETRIERPQMIGPYRVLEAISRANRSEVFLVERDGLWILKRLRAPALHDPILRARFEREAKIVSQLAHPNIARLIDVHLEEGECYLVTEYVRGADLQTIARQAPNMPAEFAVDMIRQVLDALDYAHRFALPGDRPAG